MNPRAMVAVVVVTGVVAVSLAACQRDAGRSADASDGPGPSPAAPARAVGELRQVAWRGVEVDVPAGWGDATSPGGDWCAFDQGRGRPPFPTEPYVARDTTHMATLTIGCLEESDAPAAFGSVPMRYWAPHVWFELADPGGRDMTATYDGWILARRTVGGVRVNVLADGPTSDAVEGILDSAHVTATDAHGCDSTSPVQATRFVRPKPAFDVTALESVDSISVCQYDRMTGTTRPGLLGSRLLEGAVAARSLTAIQSAPTGGGPDAPQHCADDMYGDTALALRLHDGDTTHDLYVYYDRCFGNGLDDGTTRRELTRADCLPLWGGRVQLWSGSSAPFSRCHD